MTLAKPQKAQRCPEWLSFVRSLPCVVTGQRGCVAHHRIGDRFGTGKTSDFEAFPLADHIHKQLHDHGWREWEAKNGSQWQHVLATQEIGIQRGLITRNEDGTFSGTFTPNRKALKRAVEYS